MKHLLLSVAFLLCAGLALAAGAPGPGEEMAAPSTAQAPASRELPLRNEEEYTAQLNAQLNAQLQAAQEDRERRRERSRWMVVVTLSGLVIAFVALAGWALRSRQPRAVRLSRLALYLPALVVNWLVFKTLAGMGAG